MLALLAVRYDREWEYKLDDNHRPPGMNWGVIMC
jgi:hypothetical protein